MKVSVVQSGNCTQNVGENVAMLLELSKKAAETKPAKKAEKPAEDTRSAMQKLADKFRG